MLGKMVCLNILFFLHLQAGGKAGKDSGKSKAKAVSRSARAGLQVIFDIFRFSPNSRSQTFKKK